jgi:hypothetical protein
MRFFAALRMAGAGGSQWQGNGEENITETKIRHFPVASFPKDITPGIMGPCGNTGQRKVIINEQERAYRACSASWCISSQGGS